MGNLLVLVSRTPNIIHLSLPKQRRLHYHLGLGDRSDSSPIPNACHQQRRWRDKQVNIARLLFLTPFSRSDLQHHCYAGVTMNQHGDSIRNGPSSDQVQIMVRDVNPSTHCSHSCPPCK